MIESTNIFIVPVLGIVVLGALLLTARWASPSLGWGMLGVFGVVFGGPSTIVLPSVDATELRNASAPSSSSRAADELDKGAGESDVAESGKSDSESPIVIDRPSIPDWARQPDVLSGPVHSMVAVDTVEGLDAKLTEKTNEYINWYIGDDVASDAINYDIQFIKQHLLVKTEHRQREMSGEKVSAAYALLEFDESFRRQLDEQWRDAVSKRRVLFAGLIGGSVLALLGVVLSYFRLDSATRGFYTGRLQFVSIAAILTLIAVGVLMARWIPWS